MNISLKILNSNIATEITIYQNVYTLSAYRMIFLIGSGLTLISLLITTIFFKDIDVEEEMALSE